MLDPVVTGHDPWRVLWPDGDDVAGNTDAIRLGRGSRSCKPLP